MKDTLEALGLSIGLALLTVGGVIASFISAILTILFWLAAVVAVGWGLLVLIQGG